MRSIAPRTVALLSLIALAVAACGSPPKRPATLLAPTEEQMKIRNMQTRTFDISDRRVAMRAVISTLQDLGFIIERANEPLGLVTAARFAEPQYYDVVGVTVTVRSLEGEQTSIRANAIFNHQPIHDPEVYGNFFASLERALFVGRNEP